MVIYVSCQNEIVEDIIFPKIITISYFYMVRERSVKYVAIKKLTGVVDVVLKDADNKESKPAIQDNHDGTYKVDFVPDKSVEATVLLNNQPVPSSPFKISVQPLPFDISSQPQHYEAFTVSSDEAAINPHVQPSQGTRLGQEPDVTKVRVYGPALESPASSGHPTHFVVDTRESGPGKTK